MFRLWHYPGLPDNKQEERNLEKFISADQIRKKVEEIAAAINRDYKGKAPIIIGILNGSFIFMSDLIRELDLDCEVDFIKISSYGDGQDSTGDIKLLKSLNCKITGRDVIIVEDIIDTGLSINYIRDLILKEEPASARFATLLYKESKSNLEFQLDYIGFKIKDEFLVGYGLDFAQKHRNLKDIYVL